MTDKKFRHSYPFAELLTGERFHFADDEHKTVYQVQQTEGKTIQIKTDLEAHYNYPTAAQSRSRIIFLRHTGTK